MMRLGAWLVGLSMALILPARAFATGSLPKVVSLDSCADQYVLALASPEQILALSPNARGVFSYYREQAEAYPAHDGTAESILALKPDLAVRTGVGDFTLSAFLERLGISLLATGLPDDVAAIQADLRTFGVALGQEARAEEMIAHMNARLAEFGDLGEGAKKALYLSPGGSTTGEKTFLGQVLRLAGLNNHMSEKGLESWGHVDLEDLVLDPPEVIIGSFFDARQGMADSWRLADHPAMRDVMARAQFIDVPSRLLACPAWMMLDAVELIRAELEVRDDPK